MKEVELNKKLAEWAGFVEADIKKHYYWTVGGERLAKWIEPVKDYHIKLPNFTQSLDACVEWLVPKIGALSEMVLRKIPDGYQWQINRHRKHISEFVIGEGRTEALALCLAIEKLIDGENK